MNDIKFASDVLTYLFAISIVLCIGFIGLFLGIIAIVNALKAVADAITRITTKPPVSGYHFVGGGFEIMKTYAEDRPHDDVLFTPSQLVDSEGTAVDPQPVLNYTFTSDDPNGVVIADNGNGSVGLDYGKAEKLADGSYRIFEIRAESNEIDIGGGVMLKDVKTEQIQLVPGVAAGFANGGFQLPD